MTVLKARAWRLRLAVTDVAAKEAVHGLGAFHIALMSRCVILVGGFLEFKSILEFALEIAVWRKGETLGGLALA